jgi:hypothetical protein
MEAVKARLDKRDWNFVASRLGLHRVLPQGRLSPLEREMTGREPERVHARARGGRDFGTYAGGTSSGHRPHRIRPPGERNEIEQALLYGTKKYSQVHDQARLPEGAQTDGR